MHNNLWCCPFFVHCNVHFIFNFQNRKNTNSVIGKLHNFFVREVVFVKHIKFLSFFRMNVVGVRPENGWRAWEEVEEDASEEDAGGQKRKRQARCATSIHPRTMRRGLELLGTAAAQETREHVGNHWQMHATAAKTHFLACRQNHPDD